MYAIIRTGGKQYRVKAGDKVKVDKLNRDLGSEFEVEEVLLVGGEKTFVGTPKVEKASVKAVVVQHAKHSKILVFKKKRRKGYRRTQGHRQDFTELFIQEISNPEGDAVKAESSAVVIDPAKKAERLKALKEKATGNKKQAKKAPAKKAKTAKKATKKKATKKASTKKKTATKKKATKKKSS